jgi:hypothetical protein
MFSASEITQLFSVVTNVVRSTQKFDDACYKQKPRHSVPETHMLDRICKFSPKFVPSLLDSIQVLKVNLNLLSKRYYYNFFFTNSLIFKPFQQPTHKI